MSDLVEDLLSFWVASRELIIKFSVVWPDVHWSECMEVVDKLDIVLQVGEEGSNCL